MAKNGATRQSLTDTSVPLDKLADVDQIDEILRGAISGTRDQVHEAIKRVLERWPGRKPYEIYARFHWLKDQWLRSLDGNRRWQRAEWNAECIAMLRSFYSQGLAGARQAGRVMPARYPGLTRRAIQRMAAKLGLTNPCGPGRPWTQDEEGALRWHAGEKDVTFLIRKLKRSEAAIRQRLSRLGESAKVPMPNYFNLHQISIMLGVSDGIVRAWFEKGLFEPYGNVKRNGSGRSKVLIHQRTVFAFCVTHPEKVNANRAHADVLKLLAERKKQPNDWHGRRQHLTQRKVCPRCGRPIVGNVYFRHLQHCGMKQSLPVLRTSPNGRLDQASSAPNV